MPSTETTTLDLDVAPTATSLVKPGPAPKVVASLGMGLDSAVMLLRWIEEPASRDFALSELVVVTGMVGDEYESTRRLVERHLLPRFRENKIRFVQCGRSQRTVSRGEGVVVFDDSTEPTRLHFRGDYTLSMEMLAAGTIPQRGGARKCSVHAKGWALDPVIASLTQGRPYRHAIGFEVNERGRAAKDSMFNTTTRTGWYPLLEWGFDRAKCHEYAFAVLGETFEKSACGFCPFSMSSEAGRRDLMRRYRAEPERGAQALLMEDVARRLNPKQTLIDGSSLSAAVGAAGVAEAVAAYERMRADLPWAVYEVRRVTPPTASGKRGITARSVRALARGTRGDMEALLAQLPGQAVTDDAGITRLHRRCAGNCEHLVVAAPAVVEDKQRPAFDRFWEEAHDGHATLF